MKYLLMSIFLWVFFSKSAIAQDSKFDSLKFYGMPYYSETHNRIDRYSIVVYGDSVHIKDKIMIQELFDNLKKLTKTSSNARLKNLRTDFEPDLINIRALFIFQQKGKSITVGVSSEEMMFIDNTLYFLNNKKLKKAVLPSMELYKILFPTKEDLTK